MNILEDSSGAFAVIVVGDAEGEPRSSVIAYGRQDAKEALSLLSLPDETRELAHREIDAHCMPGDGSRLIVIDGPGGADASKALAVGLGEAVDRMCVQVFADWTATVADCRLGDRERLALVVTYDPAAGVFYAALVESRDNLPQRYRAAAPVIHAEGREANGVDPSRDAVLLPESVAGMFALGWATLRPSALMRAVPRPSAVESTFRVQRVPSLASISFVRDAARVTAVFAYRLDEAYTELRWTSGRAPVAAWLREAPNLLPEQVADALGNIARILTEPDGPSCEVSGPGGAQMATAYALGFDLESCGMALSVAPLVTLNVGVTVNGREGMALTIHTATDRGRYFGALIPNRQDIFDFYNKHDEFIHDTEEPLGDLVRGRDVIPLPEAVTNLLVLGLWQMGVAPTN